MTCLVYYKETLEDIITMVKHAAHWEALTELNKTVAA